MTIRYEVKCKKCGKDDIILTTENIEEAKKKLKMGGNRHQTPYLKYNCNGECKFVRIMEEPKTDVDTETEKPSSLYNEAQLAKIKNSTCIACKYNLDKCSKSPEMLAICQVESLEYRLRSGKYNIGNNIGTGTCKFAEDINGIIIDGVPVYVKDIWRLFIARADTFSLYKAEDAGKEIVRTPDTKRPPTDNDVLQSLLGNITIGFRPVDPETNMCKWICYDIDKHSCEKTIYKANPGKSVDKIVKLLKKWYALTGYIELSGSPDSYHIWVFIEPTDNDIVLKFDQAFKARCDPSINQTIDKRVEDGQGHMIKLPYTINIKNGVRSKFIELIDLSEIQPEKLPKVIV